MTYYDYLSLMPLRYNTAINHGSRQVDNVIVARAPRLTRNAWPLACQLPFLDNMQFRISQGNGMGDHG